MDRQRLSVFVATWSPSYAAFDAANKEDTLCVIENSDECAQPVCGLASKTAINSDSSTRGNLARLLSMDPKKSNHAIDLI